ncbi:hypothetical protein [Mucilaginibacter sp.]|uniref:hypothetical protein n=1 Tax=Mucilaginibacter sp. TaxID=1882438 RepID=UPI0035BC71C0
MISSFPTSPLLNMAGQASFEFSPNYNILQLPTVIRRTVTLPIQFKPGTNFMTGVSSLGQLNFEEDSITSEGGTYYPWVISGFYPGDGDEVVDLFQDMEKVLHIVATKDFTNKIRLVGLNAPLTFNAKFQSGLVPGEARGHAFSFTGAGLERAPYYQV